MQMQATFDPPWDFTNIWMIDEGNDYPRLQPITLSPDCNANGFPDFCEPDCNGNGVPDECDIAGISTTIASGLGLPFPLQSGVTQDVATGDFIVAAGNSLLRVTAGGFVTTIASGPSPSSRLVDVTQDVATGDFIVADTGISTLFRMTMNGVVTTIASDPLDCPTGVTQDAATGDFIVIDQGSNLFRVTAGGMVTTIASDGLPTCPWGITQDASTGDFVVSNLASGTLIRVTASGVITVIASGPPLFSFQTGITQDAATGDFIVTNFQSGTLLRVTAGGVVTILASGPPFLSTVGITQDAATGDFIVADGGNETLTLFRFHAPTSLDCNSNGIPDECEGPPCTGIVGGDMDCSGTVTMTDLPDFVDSLLAGLFTCNADANGDFAVNGLDAQAFVDLVLP